MNVNDIVGYPSNIRTTRRLIKRNESVKWTLNQRLTEKKRELTYTYRRKSEEKRREEAKTDGVKFVQWARVGCRLHVVGSWHSVGSREPRTVATTHTTFEKKKLH